MNYLAHTLLSCSDEDLLIGNFITDFISNKDKVRFSENIRKGINLHKLIDSFTDTHEQVHLANNLIRSSQGKYTPVVTDIYFDHFLIRNWSDYSSVSLPDFTVHTYSVLEQHIHIYPDMLKLLVPKMIADNFLLACENEARLRRTFQRVASRARFENRFESAYLDLEQHYEALERHFKLFFPELILEASKFCSCS